MRLSLLIADADPQARRALRRLLHPEGDVRVVAECDCGRDVMPAVAEYGPDVIIVDVQMPGLDAIELAASLRKMSQPPFVILAVEGHVPASETFRARATDHLLKPFERERIADAMQHMRSRTEERKAALLGYRVTTLLTELHDMADAVPGELAGLADARGRGFRERFAVPDGERVIIVKATDIDCIEAEGHYVRLNIGKARYQLRGTLRSLEQQLDPARFARIHRGVIVNVDRIHELHPWFAGDYLVRLLDGRELRLSRTYRAHLDAAFCHLRPR